MIIKGIDRGTTYTKDDKMNIFKSTIRKYSQDEIILDRYNQIVVEFEGEKYIIGETGESQVDLVKSKNEYTKILILTMIGLYEYENSINCYLVTGLPVGQYSNQKNDMKNIFNNKTFNISINNNKKLIKIYKAETFPEGVSAFYTTNYSDGIIIDIGGISVDVALFQDRKLIKYSTYSMGLMKYYSRLANQINHKYDTCLSEWNMERVLTKGLFVNGEQKDLEFSREHFDEIIRRISLDYDLKTQQNILLTGGGGAICKKFYDYELLNNYQFNNAIGYKNIGRMLFDA